MLQRLRVLQDAAATARPTRLLPHLWVAGAVEANSLHVLRHLGITHILNATEDLLLPEPDAAFMCAPQHPCAAPSMLSCFLAAAFLLKGRQAPCAAPSRHHTHPQRHSRPAPAGAGRCLHVRR